MISKVHHAGYVEGPGRSYHGMVYVFEEGQKREVWRCKHLHSKPEFDVRYKKNQVWEKSAKNCADNVKWDVREGKKPFDGGRGIIDHDIPWMNRIDTRTVSIGETVYDGHVTLTESGKRVITVSRKGALLASYNPDLAPYKGLTISNDIDPITAREVKVALWSLKGCLWGVIFQDSDDPIEYRNIEEVPAEGITFFDKPVRGRPQKGRKRLVLPDTEKDIGSTGSRMARNASPVVPQKTPEKLDPEDSPYLREAKGEPYINIDHDQGKRIFEVIDENGHVVERTPLRGLAFRRLDKVRNR